MLLVKDKKKDGYEAVQLGFEKKTKRVKKTEKGKEYKRLREFKTGTARIALLTAAANNFEKDVFIVPTGVNYTYHCDFRSEAIISFGQPINVKEYKALYEANSKNAVRELTEDIKDAVSKETVVINSKDDEELV